MSSDILGLASLCQAAQEAFDIFERSAPRKIRPAEAAANPKSCRRFPNSVQTAAGSARLICTTTDGYMLTLHGIPLTHHARPQNSRVNVMALGVSLAKARRQAGDGTSAGCSVALAWDDPYCSKVSINLRNPKSVAGMMTASFQLAGQSLSSEDLADGTIQAGRQG